MNEPCRINDYGDRLMRSIPVTLGVYNHDGVIGFRVIDPTGNRLVYDYNLSGDIKICEGLSNCIKEVIDGSCVPIPIGYKPQETFRSHELCSRSVWYYMAQSLDSSVGVITRAEDGKLVSDADDLLTYVFINVSSDFTHDAGYIIMIMLDFGYDKDLWIGMCCIDEDQLINIHNELILSAAKMKGLV